jgi:hypothetical protein
MFKHKNLDTLLGVGSIRAKVNAETVDVVPEVSKLKQDEAETIETDIKTEINTKPHMALPTEPHAEERLYAVLEKQIAFLENQLEVKDTQLASKDEVIKNFQVLLKMEQDTVLKLTTSKKEVEKPHFYTRWFSKFKNNEVED